MKLYVYAVRDAKGENYNPPFYQPTHGAAERAFRELVRNPDSMPGKYPEDFDLYHLGEFDDISGQLVPEPTPRHVIKGTAAAAQN